MEILCISTVPPSDSSEAGPQRFYNLTKELSQYHTLDLLVIDKESVVFSESVKKYFRSCEHFWPDFEETPTFFQRLIHRVYIAPYFWMKHKYPKTHKEISSYVKSKIARYDRIYVNEKEVTQFVPLSGAMVDVCDSASLLYLRASEYQASFIDKVRYILEAYAMMRVERYVCRSAKWVLSVSDRDTKALSRLSHGAKVHTIGLGIDLDYFKYLPSKDKPRSVSFMGVLNYGPNEDAAKYLIGEIYPRLLEIESSLRLQIIGAQPCESLVRMGQESDGDVDVTGWVDDVRPLLQGGTIFICPLRYGAGIKQKLLVAMALGCPVVVSPISIEGFDVENGVHCLIAKSPSDYAAAVEQLIENDDMRNQLIENAYRYLLENHSWQRLGERVNNLLVSDVP